MPVGILQSGAALLVPEQPPAIPDGLILHLDCCWLVTVDRIPRYLLFRARPPLPSDASDEAFMVELWVAGAPGDALATVPAFPLVGMRATDMTKLLVLISTGQLDLALGGTSWGPKTYELPNGSIAVTLSTDPHTRLVVTVANHEAALTITMNAAGVECFYEALARAERTFRHE